MLCCCKTSFLQKLPKIILRNLIAFGGKIGKQKHSSIKIHLLGDISRKGLTNLFMFKGGMHGYDFQHYLTLPFILQKFPFVSIHKLLIDTVSNSERPGTLKTFAEH
jgi:hypothetical protein